MRHFTKEEQKKYTDAISKLYKPTGVNIMDYTITTSDDLELEQMMAEVMKSGMEDEMKVKIIKRLCNPKVTYIPYYDGNERKPREPIAIYTASPTTGDPVENQPHSVCSAHETPVPMSTSANKVCGNCNGRGLVPIGGYGSGITGVEKCKVCDGEGYVGGKE